MAAVCALRGTSRKLHPLEGRGWTRVESKRRSCAAKSSGRWLAQSTRRRPPDAPPPRAPGRTTAPTRASSRTSTSPSCSSSAIRGAPRSARAACSRQRPDDDRGWATLALCQTLLGNYKFAVSAYHHALTSAPKNPWYAHNLGHLLDVALGRAAEAIGWLKRAYQSAPDSGEVAASYAHALARVGRLAEARKVLGAAPLKRASSREHAALLRWLEQGAPADKDHPLPRPAPVHALPRRGDSDEPTRRSRRPLSQARRRSVASGARCGRRRRRARRGARARPRRASRSTPSSGRGRRPSRATQRRTSPGPAPEPAGPRRARADRRASPPAIAYAIVYVDHVPLTQAEVAACFRVSVASLRGRFGELRSHLDLLPGDARYATLRRR